MGGGTKACPYYLPSIWLHWESMLNHLPLVDMIRLLRDREISPVELVDAHLRQIERHNPDVNAFTARFFEDALAAAHEAEASAVRLPLKGVPVTVKDSFDIEGVPTTCGSRLFQDLPAHGDSTAVRRLRGAGAIILGKTNCPEFLSNYETDNYVAGRSNNPWNLERTPGGSSGGESAAIAAFFSAGGIGSDGGGSIRVPAHFCGIAGLKPTPGRVSAAGHVPAICHPGGLLGVAGPMARSAADVTVLFRVLAGEDAADPFSAPVPLRDPDVVGVRVGVMTQFLDVPVQPAIRAAVLDAARCVRTIGLTADEFRPSGIERAPNLWWFFFGQLPARATRELIAGREKDAHWSGTEFLERALEEPEPTAGGLLEALAERDRMRYEMLKQMEKFPVLLLPPCGVAAFRHRERKWETPGKKIGLFEAMMPVTPFNLFGFPGLVIPWSHDADGMPVGIQLVGRPWHEEQLLEVAARLESARGPLPGPPGY